MQLSEIAKIRAISQGKGDDLAYQELLKSEIIAFNSLLIKQNYEKTGLIQQFYTQTVYNVPLKKVSIGIEIDEFVLRTLVPVPKPLVININQPFISVSNSINGRRKRTINYIEPENTEFNDYRRFTKNDLFYTFENEYIFIHGTTVLEHINIHSLFDNPLMVPIFTSECDCTFDSECIENNDLVISEYNSGLILSSFGNEAKE